jgi:NodT family efflux transporter outer membrane factor (OMF) lipoprotein
MTRRTASLCLLALAAGCAPKAQLAVAPQVLSTEWQGGKATAPGRLVSLSGQGLGEAFKSAELEALTIRALAANADIAIARTRIEQARAQLQIARAAMLPVVSASAGVSANRTDNTGGSVFDFSDAFAGLDVSFDTDLFGGRRAERRAARDRLAAAAFDRDATALVVEAEVARAYVQHAALDDRLAFLDENIAGARELERIVQVRLREGVATKVDTGLQAIEVRQLQAERLRLIEARSQTRSALAVLVGEEAPRFQLPHSRLASLTIPSFTPVQPGELLVRRPDIRAAEARIRAASGDVASARAAFLPNLRLTASTLGQAATLTGPFGATISAGAALLAPIFDGGRLRGQLFNASAAQAETVELYRRALLVALGEAQDALSAVEQSRARQLLLDRVVEEARTTLRLRRLQYIEGEADLRDVLDAQRLLVQAEDARAISTQERLNAAADLYRAMGGRAAGEAL